MGLAILSVRGGCATHLIAIVDAQYPMPVRVFHDGHRRREPFAEFDDATTALQFYEPQVTSRTNKDESHRDVRPPRAWHTPTPTAWRAPAAPIADTASDSAA